MALGEGDVEVLASALSVAIPTAGFWDFPLTRGEKFQRLIKLFCDEDQRSNELEMFLTGCVASLRLRLVQSEDNVSRLEAENKALRLEAERSEQTLKDMQEAYSRLNAEGARVQCLDPDTEALHEELGELRFKVENLTEERNLLHARLEQTRIGKAATPCKARQKSSGKPSTEEPEHENRDAQLPARALSRAEQPKVPGLSLKEKLQPCCPERSNRAFHDYVHNFTAASGHPISPVAVRGPDSRSPPLVGYPPQQPPKWFRGLLPCKNGQEDTTEPISQPVSARSARSDRGGWFSKLTPRSRGA